MNNRQFEYFTKDQQVQINKIFKIIGVNPVNAISLIKSTISYPVINILSLFLRSYIRKRLVGQLAPTADGD